MSWPFDVSFPRPGSLDDAWTSLGSAADRLADAVQAVPGLQALTDLSLAWPAPTLPDAVRDLVPQVSSGVVDLPPPASSGWDPVAQAEALLSNLDIPTLEQVIAALPPEWTGPDATGEVATGASAITRQEAYEGAALAATARIVRFLGPDATAVELDGRVFDVLGRYDDPQTGFDALHLRARDGAEDVFVIDGLETDSQPDKLSAITLADLQAEFPEFARLVADARDAALLEGREPWIVGASMGGALSEAASHETAQALLAAGVALETGAIRVVTVDALGGRDVTEDINGGALDPAALQAINAVNLRTEGDVVSRIGSHLGATISFQPVDREGHPVTLAAEEAHVNVESLLATLRSDALFEAGTWGPPAEIGGLAWLSHQVGQPLVEEALRLGVTPEPEGAGSLEIPGTAQLDPTGTRWLLDADQDGTTDLAVWLSPPAGHGSEPLLG